MKTPLAAVRTLVTEDGVPIDAAHLPCRSTDPGSSDLAIVLAHGFTFSWQRHSVWRIANRLTGTGAVMVFDFRGHGRSGGLSTVGDREIHDLDVVVAWAREKGYRRVAGVGFSMGASIVVRYAALERGLDAVVSVSGPGRWYYRGTTPMRRLHWAVEQPLGRLITRTVLHTRVHPGRWNPTPLPPAEAASRITPVPLLVVHGDRDPYFPVDHAHQIYDAAQEPKDLWIERGYGHAETAASAELIDRIGEWVAKATAAESPGDVRAVQEG